MNLSDEERHDGGRGEKRRGERKNEESVTFTTFSVNVGKEDGFTPRDLMTIINENAPRKGLEIGSIRIFGNNTKFEVDVRGINGFMSCFRNVSFNGLPFTLSEVKDRYNRSDRVENAGVLLPTINGVRQTAGVTEVAVDASEKRKKVSKAEVVPARKDKTINDG